MDAPPFETVLTFLSVRDLAATRDFYGRDLGLRIERDDPTCLIVAVGRAYLGFAPHDARLHGSERGSVASDDVVATLVTEGVDAWYRRARRLGIETEGVPRRSVGVSAYGFVARDPDGHRVEIGCFDPPLPE